ncbi:MAG: hypothetical protein PHI35_00860 [Victivallaceae bacterium]|nr:hypothetical protein [Victivallaceae bacterium]
MFTPSKNDYMVVPGIVPETTVICCEAVPASAGHGWLCSVRGRLDDAGEFFVNQTCAGFYDFCISVGNAVKLLKRRMVRLFVCITGAVCISARRMCVRFCVFRC